jgi:hypothetical protein
MAPFGGDGGECCADQIGFEKFVAGWSLPEIEKASSIQLPARILRSTRIKKRSWCSSRDLDPSSPPGYSLPGMNSRDFTAKMFEIGNR